MGQIICFYVNTHVLKSRAGHLVTLKQGKLGLEADEMAPIWIVADMYLCRFIRIAKIGNAATAYIAML